MICRDSKGDTSKQLLRLLRSSTSFLLHTVSTTGRRHLLTWVNTFTVLLKPPTLGSGQAISFNLHTPFGSSGIGRLSKFSGGADLPLAPPPPPPTCLEVEFLLLVRVLIEDDGGGLLGRDGDGSGDFLSLLLPKNFFISR